MSEDGIQFEEAEPILLDSHRLTVAAAGSNHSHTIRTVEVIVELYEGLGRADEAARWRAILP